MRALAPLFLLLAACGAESSYTATFEDAEALRGSTLVVVNAMNASVRVRSGPAGRIDATLRWPGPYEENMVAFEKDPRDLIWVRVPADVVKREGPEIDITAPEGLGIQVLGGKCRVEVSGSWSRLLVDTSEGAIVAHVDRADSGELKSHRGSVELVASGRGPTGELTAKSTSGDVSVTLPASWKGQLKFQTQTGSLDVPTHGSLQTIWDENKKGVVGRMGPPREEGAPRAPAGGVGMGSAEREQPAPLPTVWGVSGTGDVSFRVRD